MGCAAAVLCHAAPRRAMPVEAKGATRARLYEYTRVPVKQERGRSQ
jgi:hypothetical protein